MTDPTSQAPVSVSLRPVTSADREFLISVYARSRAAELAQVAWDDAQKDAFCRWQFERQEEEYNQRYPNARYDVIMVDDAPAGRIWVGVDDKQIRLLDIAILAEFQNRGVGTYLLSQLKDEAAREKKALRHMVFVLNDNAHRFYERLGFSTIEDLGGYKHMEWVAEQAEK
ncbi:MAG TPA: GNAT family N-acetyltransferase [Pyrinomonadaceae bacterium]|nr:GNAT family N-acetyltransferase [Pyrinomonadaceae bacterium]